MQKRPSVLSGLKNKVQPKKTAALWQGPEASGPLGGITFSMLSKWLTCRERFRVRYVEGWEPTKQFNHRIEYGNMWHVCEEELARMQNPQLVHVSMSGEGPVGVALKKYVQELCKKFPLSQQDILHWYKVCQVQFPVYVKYWSEHPDVANRTPLLSEQVFDVPYTLPSGRVVRMRGKWDSVDLVRDEKPKGETGRYDECARSKIKHIRCPHYASGIYLQENKTKGEIDELALQRQLTWDLQTMMYVVTLTRASECSWVDNPKVDKTFRDTLIKGVRYNVVRRPLSGGEGTIQQREATKGAKCPKCKGDGKAYMEASSGDRLGTCTKCGGAGRIGAKPPESDEEYYGRVRGVIDGTGLNSKGENYTGPSHWFMRWKFDVTAHDIKRFKVECLDPILDALCNWYHSTVGYTVPSMGVNDPAFGQHWRHPFGCDNAVNEYGASDVDSYIDTGNTVGLHRRTALFEELQ